ncbi:MAG: type I methionyl aminopeptidase [Propionicimonas sp.]|uniref:type I methionyl aminopeptidase n=1 Tax=Propionicimonas sp. TaxID=1955623 RepID=UPI002B1F6884|nr:type I methionyl aminopeptidase [Propionicimonas sp.]MEA4945177.1 type I methionyl aminopeptidase [Propionicimonas sp.]
MIEILNPAGVARARVSGALVGDILQTIRSRATVGTNLLEIDEWTRSLIVAAGAESCYVDYAPSFGRGPFGHYICTAVNDAVLHGKPRDYALADGDLLTLDLAVVKDGVAADAAISFLVGDARPPQGVALIAATERALAAGIAAARPGARIGDISAAIGAVLTEAGYPVNLQFGGHGIGSTMHQDPHVPNAGHPGRGYRLRPGLLLALEPWVMADTAELVVDDDGWTLRSATGCRTAHTEHTIAITADGAEILTLPTSQPGAADSHWPEVATPQFWEERYAITDRIWSGRVNRVLADIATELAPGTALDLGCGEGADVLWLADHGWQATGVDVSETAIARATEAAQTAGLADRVRFLAADASTLASPGRFDLVTASFLHSSAGAPRSVILRRVADWVAPGGHLLITSHAAPPPWAAGHAHDHHFPTPAEELAALDLQPGDWQLVVAESRTRATASPDGEPATLEDSVVLLRRNRPGAAF